jgi:hypothetical protein
MGQVLPFPTRERAQPAPQQPTKITEAECRLLDKIKLVTDHSLDVVNSGQALMRDFLAGKKMVGAKFEYLGKNYQVLVSLEEQTDAPPPRYA